MNPKKPQVPHTLKIWKRDGRFKWHTQSRNGKIIDSGQPNGFTRYGNCVHNLGRLEGCAYGSPAVWKNGKLQVVVNLQTGVEVWT